MPRAENPCVRHGVSILRKSSPYLIPQPRDVDNCGRFSLDCQKAPAENRSEKNPNRVAVRNCGRFQKEGSFPGPAPYTMRSLNKEVDRIQSLSSNALRRPRSTASTNNSAIYKSNALPIYMHERAQPQVQHVHAMVAHLC